MSHRSNVILSNDEEGLPLRSGSLALVGGGGILCSDHRGCYSRACRAHTRSPACQDRDVVGQRGPQRSGQPCPEALEGHTITLAAAGSITASLTLPFDGLRAS